MSDPTTAATNEQPTTLRDLALQVATYLDDLSANILRNNADMTLDPCEDPATFAEKIRTMLASKPTDSAALISSDGAFFCSPSHAVEHAYIASLAKNVAGKHALANGILSDLFIALIESRLSTADVQNQLRDWIAELDSDPT